MDKTVKNLKINAEKNICESDSVFIIAHDGIDLDGFGSAVGLALLCENFEKKAYIVINDSEIGFDTLVKRMREEKCSNFNFINKDMCFDLLSGNDTLILTDVNRASRIALGDSLDRFKNIMVIDHHDIYSDTIDTEDLYIFSNASSACEIVAGLLRISGVKFNPNISTALLAGINLDTDNYTKNRTAETLRMVAYLMNAGGDDAYITRLLMGNFSEDMEKYEVASRDNTEFRTFVREITPDEEINATTPSVTANFSIAIACDKEIRGRVTLAKAANFLLQYADASIALANIDSNTISIHGRSKGEINIGSRLEKIGGGGSARAGAAIVNDCTLEEAKQKVLSIFPPLSDAKKFID